MDLQSIRQRKALYKDHVSPLPISPPVHVALTIRMHKIHSVTSNLTPGESISEKGNYPGPCKSHVKFSDQLPVVVNGVQE